MLTSQVVQCDRGTEFGKEVKVVVEEFGGHLVKSSPGMPGSQGQDERSHQTWKKYLRYDQYSHDESDGSFLWSLHMKKYQRNYNEMLHRSIGELK